MDYLEKLPKQLAYRGDVGKGEIELLQLGDEDKGFGIVYEDAYQFIVRDKVKFPNGRVVGYVRVVTKGEIRGGCGTVVLPMIGDSVVFIRLFRHATRTWEWELPRGYQEPDISIEENAIKELKEELNVDVDSVKLVGRVKSNTGISSGEATVCVADIPKNQIENIVVSKDEAISDFQIVSKTELNQFIEQSVTCGFSLSTILFAKLNGTV